MAETPLVTEARPTVAVVGCADSSLVQDATISTTRALLPATAPMRRSRPVDIRRRFICMLPSP